MGEEFAELYSQLQAAKDENTELHNKLKMHSIYDEPISSQQSENDDSGSNFVVEFVEQKDLEQEIGAADGNAGNADFVDIQTFKDNQIRLKAASLKINNLEKEIDDIKDENNRLTKTKMNLLDKTSQQIEEMRDELQNMCKQLQSKEQTIKQLIHINKEGYDPEKDDEQKSDTNNTRSSWSNPIKNGIGLNLMTWGRSIYSTPIHTINDTKKSKIDLAISTSTEIQRLRSIIKVLSTQQTTNGLIKRNGLYPGNV